MPKQAAWVGVIKLNKPDWKYPTSAVFEKSGAIKKGGCAMSVQELREELQKTPWINPKIFVDKAKKS